VRTGEKFLTRKRANQYYENVVKATVNLPELIVSWSVMISTKCLHVKMAAELQPNRFAPRKSGGIPL
jgi:hypothetical protein